MEYMGMPLWQLLCIAGVVLVIVEIMTPTMFCLNLALACFGTAVVSLYTADYMTLTVSWVVFSCVFLLLLRPVLVRKASGKGTETGIGLYIGRQAKVLEKVDADNGVISIFDERWNARSLDKSEIAEGATVIIEKNDNLIMYVRKEK